MPLFFFDDCYFSEVEKDKYDTTQGALLTANFGNEYIVFQNSVLENINIQSSLPIIYGDSMTLSIKDSTINNCHSNEGSLFYYNKHWGNRYSVFENTHFINTSSILKSNKGNFDFTNCTFHNSTIKTPLAAIAEATDSKVLLTDVEISNLTIMGPLINKYSNITITNVTLDNVYTNSKALFHIIKTNASVNNLTVKNLKCVGDADDSSLILFDAVEGHHELRISHFMAEHCQSNGPLIKLIGNSVRMTFRYASVNNLKIYGSVIESKSPKTEIVMKYSNFDGNTNDKRNGCGIIHLNHNINATISNNVFTNNHNNCNGGVVCFDRISNMELHLSSNNFEGNSAINGGALYFADSPEEYVFEKHDMNIRNNTFIRNSVKDYGGAIYSDYSWMYLVSAKNNNFTGNTAGIVGAGLFAPRMVLKTIFNMNNNTFMDNKVAGSYPNDYSSYPTYINLTSNIKTSSIHSGDMFPLNFTLYDDFGNVFEDFNKFYSSITLKVFMIKRNNPEGDDDNDEDYEDYEDYENYKEYENYENFLKENNLPKPYFLKGNVGLFSKGLCGLNKLYIYANPGYYKLKAAIENYNHKDIIMNFDPINITIKDCKASQVKLYDMNGILYCENPKCYKSCPVDISASCVSPSKFENNIHNNNCTCYEGYGGDNCTQKIFIEFSTYKKVTMIITIPIIILVVLFMLFIIIFRHQCIIVDIGPRKIFFFSLGSLLFFISNFYSTYMDYTGCAFNLFYKHTGIAMILAVFYILTLLNYKLGFKLNKYRNISNAHLLTEDSMDEIDYPVKEQINNDDNNNNNNYIEKSRITELSSSTKKEKSLITSYMSISSHSNIREGIKKVKDEEKKSRTLDTFGEFNESVVKKIKKIKSIYLEVIMANILFLASIIIIIACQLQYNSQQSEEEKFIQSNNGLWTYKCNLIKVNEIYSLVELIIFISILYRGNMMFKYENIFKYTTFVTICSMVGVVFGPLVNFLGQTIFANQRYEKEIFVAVLNTACFLVIFIIFAGPIVYSICTNKGNDRSTYFIYKRHDFCPIHESTICGCKLKMNKTELLLHIKRSIDFYAVCSLLYVFVDGKLVYVNSRNKINILNYT